MGVAARALERKFGRDGVLQLASLKACCPLSPLYLQSNFHTMHGST